VSPGSLTPVWATGPCGAGDKRIRPTRPQALQFQRGDVRAGSADPQIVRAAGWAFVVNSHLMKVTHGKIIARGLANRCPNCGGNTLFRAGSYFQLNKECPQCGLRIEKDEGFFLGAMSLNYGVTLVVFLAPVALCWYAGLIGDTAAIVLAVAFSLVVPVAFYRSSRSWQLMLYYSFLPQHLPANRRDLVHEDENI